MAAATGALRLAAFDALVDVLRDMPPDVRTRVAEALRDDPASGPRDVAGVTTMVDREAARAEAVWNDAVEGRLPDTPDELREALGRRGASAPLEHASRDDRCGAGREREVGRSRAPRVARASRVAASGARAARQPAGALRPARNPRGRRRRGFRRRSSPRCTSSATGRASSRSPRRGARPRSTRARTAPDGGSSSRRPSRRSRSARRSRSGTRR